MYKETIICGIIIIVIIILNVITQNYTKNSTVEIGELLSNIKNSIENLDNETVNQQLDILDKTWEKKHDILAYYIEHNELEKVDTAIIQTRNFIEKDDNSNAISQLETGKFVLKHIEEKYKFNLQNIF